AYVRSKGIRRGKSGWRMMMEKGASMSSTAVSSTEARGQSRQSDPAWAAALLELLTVAQSKVEVDRQAAQVCLSRATALVLANLERDGEPKSGETAFRGGLPRWQAKRLV